MNDQTGSVEQMIKWNEAHQIALSDGLAGRIVDQAVAPGGRRQYSRTLMWEQVEAALVIETGAQEFLAAVGLGPVEIGAQAQRARRHLLHALQAQQEGTHKDQKVTKVDTGFPGKPMK